MNGLYENGRQKALDFDPFLSHETKNVFCKTKKIFFVFAVYETINIHLSNVLTDHFSNSISEKNTKGIPTKFSQCPFKNILHRLPLSNRGIYIQIIHVRRKAIFTFYGTCIACVNNITFQIGYFT